MTDRWDDLILRKCNAVLRFKILRHDKILFNFFNKMPTTLQRLLNKCEILIFFIKKIERLFLYIKILKLLIFSIIL